jgi:hypothetical protein
MHSLSAKRKRQTEDPEWHHTDDRVSKLAVFKRRKKLGIRPVRQAVNRSPVEVTGTERIAMMNARTISRGSQSIASRSWRSQAQGAQVQATFSWAATAPLLQIPLAEVLGGRRIKDLSAEEYLAMAKSIDKLRR